MKNLILATILLASSHYLLGQCPSAYSPSLPVNNNSSFTQSGIDTDHFTCNEENNDYSTTAKSGSSGFNFSFSYNIESGTYPTSEIDLFSIYLVDAGTQQSAEKLLSLSIKGQQVLIEKLVMFKECTAWSDEYCTTWNTPDYGYMTYSTWDDQFLESTSGYIDLLYNDNRMQITCRESANNSNEKRDFNYNGLNLSAIVEKASQSGKALMLKIHAKNGIAMTGMSADFGNRFYDENTVISELDGNGNETLTNDRSPKTNFPQSSGGSGARVASSEEEEVAAEVTSIEDQLISDKLSIYPNPVEDQFTVRLPNGSGNRFSVALFNLNGKVVHARELSGIDEYTINVSEYNAGVYILRVQGEFSSDTRKVIVK